jgi:hypothetical protein
MTQNNLQLIIIRLYYFTRNNVELITNSCAFHILSAEEDFLAHLAFFVRRPSVNISVPEKHRRKNILMIYIHVYIYVLFITRLRKIKLDS